MMSGWMEYTFRQWVDSTHACMYTHARTLTHAHTASILSLFCVLGWGGGINEPVFNLNHPGNTNECKTVKYLSEAVLQFCKIVFQFYGTEATVLHFVLIAAITCTLLAFLLIIVKVKEVSDSVENIFKIG